MAFAMFILRFLVYAFVLGIAYAISQYFWTSNGLDLVSDLLGLHALGVTLLTFAPLILALLALVARPLATFVLFYLVGAVLTAPFALARFGS